MKYRFYKHFDSQKFWATDVIDREVFYSVRRSEAALFTELDWLQWAEAYGLEREEVPQGEAKRSGEDVVMRLIDAPMLPGLD